MRFPERPWNISEMPRKHVLVCEDTLVGQARMATHFANESYPHGKVYVTYAPCAEIAAAVIEAMPVHLLILDHDMPYGNGTDLLLWLKDRDAPHPFVITFSGIPQNNVNMQAIHPPANRFTKEEVISGKADDLIRRILTL